MSLSCVRKNSDFLPTQIFTREYTTQGPVRICQNQHLIVQIGLTPAFLTTMITPTARGRRNTMPTTAIGMVSINVGFKTMWMNSSLRVTNTVFSFSKSFRWCIRFKTRTSFLKRAGKNPKKLRSINSPSQGLETNCDRSRCSPISLPMIHGNGIFTRTCIHGI